MASMPGWQVGRDGDQNSCQAIHCNSGDCPGCARQRRTRHNHQRDVWIWSKCWHRPAFRNSSLGRWTGDRTKGDNLLLEPLHHTKSDISRTLIALFDRQTVLPDELTQWINPFQCWESWLRGLRHSSSREHSGICYFPFSSLFLAGSLSRCLDTQGAVLPGYKLQPSRAMLQNFDAIEYCAFQDGQCFPLTRQNVPDDETNELFVKSLVSPTFDLWVFCFCSWRPPDAMLWLLLFHRHAIFRLRQMSSVSLENTLPPHIIFLFILHWLKLLGWWGILAGNYIHWKLPGNSTLPWMKTHRNEQFIKNTCSQLSEGFCENCVSQTYAHTSWSCNHPSPCDFMF